MIICKELPTKTLPQTHNRTLLATILLSLLLHCLVALPFLFIFIEEITLPVKDIPMQIDIIGMVPENTPSQDTSPLPLPPIPETEATPTPPQEVENEEKTNDDIQDDIQNDIQEAPPKEVIPLPLIKESSIPSAPKPKPTAKIKAQKKTVRNIPSPSPATKQRSATTPNIVARYEQSIALWFKEHRIYGNLGQQTALLRIRIYRNGALNFYHLDESTGNTLLDQQIIDTAKKASPFPPIPAYYSSATEEEFILPINTFED